MPIENKKKEPDILFVLYKMAIDLKNRAISSRNAGSYEFCNEYVSTYNSLREKVLEELEKGRITIPLPKVSYTSWANLEGMDKLSEVAMAAGQIVSLLEGLRSSFEENVETLKIEKQQLEKELKSIKPMIPSEVTIKTPMKIQKIINELNDSYIRGSNTSSGFLLRKLIDNSIHIKFQMNKNEDRLKDPQNKQFYDLPKKIDIAAAEGILPQNIANQLKKIKLFGDSATHSFNVELTPQDIEDAKIPTRLAIEEIFS